MMRIYMLTSRPYMLDCAHRRAEAKRIAGLLSHVPAELDVGGHMAHVYASHFRKAAKQQQAEEDQVIAAAAAAVADAGGKKLV